MSNLCSCYPLTVPLMHPRPDVRWLDRLPDWDFDRKFCGGEMGKKSTKCRGLFSTKWRWSTQIFNLHSRVKKITQQKKWKSFEARLLQNRSRCVSQKNWWPGMASYENTHRFWLAEWTTNITNTFCLQLVYLQSYILGYSRYPKTQWCWSTFIYIWIVGG